MRCAAVDATVTLSNVVRTGPRVARREPVCLLLHGQRELTQFVRAAQDVSRASTLTDEHELPFLDQLTQKLLDPLARESGGFPNARVRDRATLGEVENELLQLQSRQAQSCRGPQSFGEEVMIPSCLNSRAWYAVWV